MKPIVGNFWARVTPGRMRTSRTRMRRRDIRYLHEKPVCDKSTSPRQDLRRREGERLHDGVKRRQRRLEVVGCRLVELCHAVLQILLHFATRQTIRIEIV